VQESSDGWPFYWASLRQTGAAGEEKVRSCCPTGDSPQASNPQTRAARVKISSPVCVWPAALSGRPFGWHFIDVWPANLGRFYELRAREQGQPSGQRLLLLLEEARKLPPIRNHWRVCVRLFVCLSGARATKITTTISETISPLYWQPRA